MYRDAPFDYGRKGTLIPKAADRGKSDSGVGFNPHRAIQQNLIIEVENVGTTIIPLSAGAIQEIQAANRSKTGLATAGTIGFEEAIRRATGQTPAADMPPVHAVTDETRPIAEGRIANVAPLPPQQFVDPAQEQAALKQIPPSAWAVTEQHRSVALAVARTRVAFSGPFGSLTMPFDAAFIDGVCLVLIQCCDDGCFYKGPMNSEQHIRIEFNSQIFWCLPVVQYTLPDGKTSHTVYAIDKEKMAEEDSNGKTQ
jgi:hypothetical protein